jgi:poly(3-hydroxybutyrate) depolymerase
MVVGAAVAATATLAACSTSPTVTGFIAPDNRGVRPGKVTVGDGGQADAERGMRTVLPAEASPGCGMATTQATGGYVEHALTVPGVPAAAAQRQYFVRLPAGYDPGKPYRTIYLGGGCKPIAELEPTTDVVYPIEQLSGEEAILVAMMPSLYKGADYNAPDCATKMTCQYCFDDGAHSTTPESIEYPYFDLLHQTVEANYCVDKNRQFFAGYSSGGWMAHQLGCEFPDVLRAQGSVTGGLPGAIANGSKTCKDQPIAALLIHDYNDRSNPYSGSVAALERLLVLNGCAGGTTMATAPEAPYQIPSVPSTAVFGCVEYVGCPIDYPIVFCTSTDQQHNSQTTNAVPEFWEFFRQF